MPKGKKVYLCRNGPYDEYKVPAEMGNRWPYVLHYDEDHMVVGYYEFDPNHQCYFWADEPPITTIREHKGGHYHGR